jgi:hypothetical protein
MLGWYTVHGGPPGTGRDRAAGDHVRGAWLPSLTLATPRRSSLCETTHRPHLRTRCCSSHRLAIPPRVIIPLLPDLPAGSLVTCWPWTHRKLVCNAWTYILGSQPKLHQFGRNFGYIFFIHAWECIPILLERLCWYHFYCRTFRYDQLLTAINCLRHQLA